MDNLRKLFIMAGGFRRFVILTILRCPFDALNTVIQASFLKFAFGAIGKENPNELYLVCVLFGMGCMFLFLYNGIVWTIYSTYVTRWVASIRRVLFRHITSLSLLQIESRPSGDWITRLNADVQAATAILNQPIHLPHAVVSTVNICVSTVILVLINPVLFGLIISFVIPHILISQLYITKPMTKLAMDVQEATARNTTDMNALITCADSAIIYDAQGFLLRCFEESSLALRKANMKLQHQRAKGSGFLPLMGMSGYLVVLLVGGGWVATGTMDFGELTALFQYRGSMLKSSMMLTDSLMNIKTALAGIQRVNETMNIALEE